MDIQVHGFNALSAIWPGCLTNSVFGHIVRKKINWKSLEAVLLTEKIKGKREREKKRLWTGCGEKWTRHITSM